MVSVLIAAGATGGHVYPALAVAHVLRADGHDVGFVGGDRIEARLVPAAGFVLHRLPSRGLPRTERGAAGRAKVALRAAGVARVTAVSVARAMRLLRRVRPDVVLAMGGHASLAPALAAGLGRVRLVLHEQNARLAGAHRLASRYAAALAISLPLEDAASLRPMTVVETGNPLRAEILALADPSLRASKREAARSRFGLAAGRPTVLAFGGSLGARPINEALPNAARSLGDAQVIHVAGADHEASVRAAWQASGRAATVLGYVDAMDEAYAAADLVVSRSGATTVAELAVTSLPSVLIPLPFAPGGAQAANARALASRGAATVVPEGDGFADRLADAISTLVGDASARERMATRAGELAHPDAARRLADVVVGVV